MAYCEHDCKCEKKDTPDLVEKLFPTHLEPKNSPVNVNKESVQTVLNTVIERNINIQDRLEILLGQDSPNVSGDDFNFSVSEAADKINSQTERIATLITEISLKVGSRL